MSHAIKLVTTNLGAGLEVRPHFDSYEIQLLMNNPNTCGATKAMDHSNETSTWGIQATFPDQLASAKRRVYDCALSIVKVMDANGIGAWIENSFE